MISSALRAEPLLSRAPSAPFTRLLPFADEYFSLEARTAALQRFFDVPSGRERPGRYWRVDLDAIDIDDLQLDPENGSVEVRSSDARVRVGDPPDCLGISAASQSKFGALAMAFAHRYAFVSIPSGIDVEDPIVITYRAGGGALFPYTCIHVERGARATIVERVEGDAAFVSGIVEVVTGEGSEARFSALQVLDDESRFFSTLAALPGKDASLELLTADLGAELSVGEIDVSLLGEGADAQLVSLFFPSGRQHVDLRSTVDHRVGGARSQTTVRSAANERGQGRYVGNIRIAPDAQKSDASLRDDALLLSPNAHIDSVPALEIAANDVKAYHGATVGALDAEMLFYMTTRGIDREHAERMVTLGFFEPAIDRFPAHVREELRERLAARAR